LKGGIMLTIRTFPMGLLILILLISGLLAEAHADDRLWAALRSGDAVAIMRHALAPGTGDPAGFQLTNCTTQRNLSAGGRRQAQAIGAAFHQQGIPAARVLSSRWCRCLDTARLLELGAVEPYPPLDSFFSMSDRQAGQTAAVREMLRQPRTGPLVLVTHQVNITALTGIVPSSGEIVVIRPGPDGDLEVLGQLKPAGSGN
jgi:phosphohistidine phosphatase SixA